MPGPALLLALLLARPAAAGPPAAGPAVAVDPAVAAEARRLVEEIEDELAEGKWQAADDHHRRLVALPGVVLAYEDHWRGYLAARALGDVIAQDERLAAAGAVRLTDEVLDARARLLAWYGRVELSLARRLDPRPPLEMEEVPFDADQRRVYERAAAALAEAGRYAGLLPLGQYRVGETRFEIVGELEPVVIKIRR